MRWVVQFTANLAKEGEEREESLSPTNHVLVMQLTSSVVLGTRYICCGSNCDEHYKWATRSRANEMIHCLVSGWKRMKI